MRNRKKILFNRKMTALLTIGLIFFLHGISSAQNWNDLSDMQRIQKVEAGMGKTWAVIIANSSYTHWPALNDQPYKDAEKIKSVLEGYKITTYVKKDLTRNEFDLYLRDLSRQLRRYRVNSLLLYYAGHGAFDKELSKKGYWVPIDAKRNTYSDYISEDVIKTFLKSYSESCRHVLLMADCCFSGAVLRGDPIIKPTKADLYNLSRDTGKRSVFGITSGRQDESVVNKSYFVRAFVDVLERNQNRFYSVDDLSYEVSKRVSRTLLGQSPQAGWISDVETDFGKFIFVRKQSHIIKVREHNPEPPPVFPEPKREENRGEEDQPLPGHEGGEFIWKSQKSVKPLVIKPGPVSLSPGIKPIKRSGTTKNDQPQNTFLSDLGIKLVQIKGGTFQMGDQFGDGDADEKPVHTVILSDYALGATEVTVGQFRRFVRNTGYRTTAEKDSGAVVWTGQEWERKKDANWQNPYFEQADNHPVTCVSWFDAEAFCKWLSQKSGRTVRLPTEAEWEYAARNQGKRVKYPNGDLLTYDDANFWGSDGKDKWKKSTAPVRSFAPNDVGLYDMAGNVWEWCSDWYGKGYYDESPTKNPRGPTSGSGRVLRGGGWSGYAGYCRVAYRYDIGPGWGNDAVGFRLVFVP